MLNTLNFKFLIPVLALVLMPEFSFAQTPEEDIKLSDQLCSLRELFCTGAGIAITTVAIIIIGFLAISGKISWGFVIIIFAAIVIFASASDVANLFLDGHEVTCEC